MSVTRYAQAGETYPTIVELADFVRGIPAVERCAVKYAGNRIDAYRLHTTIAQDTDLSSHQFLANQIDPAVAADVGPTAIGGVVVEADVEGDVGCRAPENGALDLNTPQPRSVRRVVADHV